MVYGAIGGGSAVTQKEIHGKIVRGGIVSAFFFFGARRLRRVRRILSRYDRSVCGSQTARSS
jgi:hypothetical protein